MKFPAKINMIFVSAFLVANYTNAQQGAAIGTTNPKPSAAFQVGERVSSINKGVLIPRIDLSSDPKPIPTPTDGLLVYNKSSGFLAYSNAGTWTDIAPVPSGTVIMWGGDVSSLPDGWVLCDGRTYNLEGVSTSGGIPTPDLRGQFIAGYSNAGDYATLNPVTAGGAFHALTVAEMPSHSHSISSDHRHTVGFSASSHGHDFSVSDAEKSTGVIAGASTAPVAGFHYLPVDNPKSTSRVGTTVTVGSSGTGISVGETGSSQAIDNRPPYYVLAFIMKL
jgi:microcystin-dependent protein